MVRCTYTVSGLVANSLTPALVPSALVASRPVPRPELLPVPIPVPRREAAGQTADVPALSERGPHDASEDGRPPARPAAVAQRLGGERGRGTSRVLLVEDDPAIAAVLEQALRSQGYRPCFAHDESHALACTESCPEVALVVIDAAAPGPAGPRLLARMRANPRSRHIPVLLCVVPGSAETIARCKTLGSVHYLRNPVEPDEFVERVGEVIEEETPTLRDRWWAQSRSGLGPEGYDRLSRNFAGRIEEAIFASEALVRQRAGAPPVLDSLCALRRQAEQLGAERLAFLLDRAACEDMASNPNRCRRVCRALWLELRRLQRVLESQPSAHGTREGER